MTLAVLRTLWLELWRDRGALVMAFILPVVFFLVFAWIFSGTGGSDMRIQLVITDEVGDADSAALIEALLASGTVERLGADQTIDAERAEGIVRRGKADVGLIFRRPLREPPDPAAPPIVILFDPARGVAASMLGGRIQQAFVEALPDVALGQIVRVLDTQFLSLDDAQRARLDAGLGAMRSGAAGEQDFSSALYERRPVIAARKSKSTVAYYAGAVAILFVLFSAVHTAISLLDDRDAGIIDRVLAGPSGIQVLVGARFLFLVVQSFLQMLVIFLVAWLGYGVDLPGNLVGFTLTSSAVAVCAAGLALALVAACQTRRQAQNVSTVAILLLSAVGGSMVPRFFMPPLMQDLGWLTPNTWGLEAFASVFWREEGLASLVLPLTLLVGTGLVALFVARLLVRRWETI